MPRRNFFLLGIAIIIGLVVTYATLVYARPHSFQGSLIDPPVPAPDFELTDQKEQLFRLSDQKENVVLVFFGYTYCPDVCPVTLSDFEQIKSRLGKQSENIRFVFVTTDPERDTPDQLRRYLANFDPGILGLTGPTEDLEKIWQAYGVYRAKVEGDSFEDYLLDHSSRIYLIDKDGNLRLTYLFGTDSAAIASDVAYVLREN